MRPSRSSSTPEGFDHRRFLPGQTGQLLARAAPEAGMGAAVTAGWAAVLWTAGWITLRRRDIV